MGVWLVRGVLNLLRYDTVAIAGDYGPPSVEKPLGLLPVVRDFLARLDVVGIVDRLCPVREDARITHGQVVAALVAHRLTAPGAIVHVEDWARAWAVEEMFVLPPDALNDDRIGRALEAVADRCDEIVGSIGAAAIAVFGLEMARVHWDLTSISVHGVYPDADDDHPTPRHGHPKDGRTDLKQIQTGQGVTADGGVPVFWKVYDGGAAEVSQVEAAMRAIRGLAAERRFLLVGDSKLVSYSNLSAIDAAGVCFLAPASKTLIPNTVLAGLDWASARILDHVPARDAGKFAHQRASHRAREGVTVLRGPRAVDPPLSVRTVYIWSSEHQKAARAAREKKIDTAREDLVRLRRNLGKYGYTSEAAVTDRVEAIRRRHGVTAWLRTQVGTDDDTGTPTLLWHFDERTLAIDTAADGWFALLTNQTTGEADTGEVFAEYKGQDVVERRHRAFKGPLAVAPIFLENNARICGLLHTVCIALLVFALVERQARQATGPDGKVPGLYAGRARPPHRPTHRQSPRRPAPRARPQRPTRLHPPPQPAPAAAARYPRRRPHPTTMIATRSTETP
ncbi:IS1634 family transposase [Protofrankia symbiont of Coriaria ruscifolia]|uniref:IS1634 family transposase n=1 Tax=Protofrankia symbiont of Coriaria ruscifolia TaxID=1306542 RepID=UPI001F5F142A|nr:IS1634 family transposase [Protofrankia symbiont of Coriaria ruscifolia]